MKTALLIACSAVAVYACSANKPADDPSRVSMSNDQTSGMNSGSEGSTRWNDSTGSASTTAPRHEPAAAAESHPVTPPTTITPSPTATTPPPKTSDPAVVSNVPASVQGSGAVQPDDTGVNKRDRAPSARTPMDQGNGASDLKITQQIRQAVMKDDHLSFTAKNVKIITSNGKVTLRGPVKTEEEHAAIAASARQIAGDANVDDQIEVKQQKEAK